MKKLVFKKKVLVNLSDQQQSQIKGGTDYLCTNFDTCDCVTRNTCNTCVVCPTTDAFGTDCCSADLEICNTNSDPYCGAC